MLLARNQDHNSDLCHILVYLGLAYLRPVSRDLHVARSWAKGWRSSLGLLMLERSAAGGQGRGHRGEGALEHGLL